MIALSVKDVKQFMSKLLVKDTFDNLLLCEAVITMGNTCTIDGSINRTFYTEEEYEALDNKKYSCWSEIKPFIFNFIKGNKVPAALRIVFTLPWDICEQLIISSGSELKTENIKGLYINLRYQDGLLNLSTASSLDVFTLDKSLDTAFEKYLRVFLDNAGIEYSE